MCVKNIKEINKLRCIPINFAYLIVLNLTNSQQSLPLNHLFVFSCHLLRQFRIKMITYEKFDNLSECRIKDLILKHVPDFFFFFFWQAQIPLLRKCSHSSWFDLWSGFVLQWSHREINRYRYFFPFQLNRIFLCLFQSPFSSRIFRPQCVKRAEIQKRRAVRKNPARPHHRYETVDRTAFMICAFIIEYLQRLTEVNVESLFVTEPQCLPIQWLREPENEGVV